MLLFSSYSVNAQMEISKMEKILLDKKDSIGTPDFKALVNISGDYYTNSNSVTNSFVRKLVYQGQFIDDADKDRESNRLKKYNRFGLDEQASVNGIYNAKKVTYVFGLTQRAFLGAHFSSDLFELVFRGNASFAGKEANLKKTSIQAFDYQSLYIGVQKQFKEGRYLLGASASFIRGGQYVGLKAKNTSLYTEPTGEYVLLEGDINFSRVSSEANTSALKSHGKGAGLNLLFAMKHKKNLLSVELRDLGFITWKGLKTYYGDSTFQYNGILLNDVLSPGASIVPDITLDSIAALIGLNTAVKNKTMLLPTILNVSYVISPNKKFSRTIGLRYMFTAGYIPRVYIREADFIGKGFTLVNTFSYGGFGRLDYELGMLKKFKNSVIVSVNLFAFEYLVLPGKSSGHGLNIGLTKLF